ATDHSPPSLHDALPISTVGRTRRTCTTWTTGTRGRGAATGSAASRRTGVSRTRQRRRPVRPTAERWGAARAGGRATWIRPVWARSEEHTSELQSRFDLV